MEVAAKKENFDREPECHCHLSSSRREGYQFGLSLTRSSKLSTLLHVEVLEH